MRSDASPQCTDEVRHVGARRRLAPTTRPVIAGCRRIRAPVFGLTAAVNLCSLRRALLDGCQAGRACPDELPDASLASQAANFP